MIKIVVFRSAAFAGLSGVSELFAAIDKATECGRKAGLEYRYASDDNGWVYWYEFATEEEAALFRLTYM